MIRTVECTRTAGHAPASLSSGLRIDGLRELVGLVLRWIRVARERRRLAQLPEHILRDIGVSREDAWYEANRPFWESSERASRR